MKTLLIGDGVAGKTSLVRQLRGEVFDNHEDTTCGINIRGKQKVGGRKIRINIWDSGGQETRRADLLGLAQPRIREGLAGIGDKTGLKPDEKLSFTGCLVSAVEITSNPLFISFNLTELFKQIRAWDKQRQRKERR